MNSWLVLHSGAGCSLLLLAGDLSNASTCQKALLLIRNVHLLNGRWIYRELFWTYCSHHVLAKPMCYYIKVPGIYTERKHWVQLAPASISKIISPSCVWIWTEKRTFRAQNLWVQKILYKRTFKVNKTHQAQARDQRLIALNTSRWNLKLAR